MPFHQFVEVGRVVVVNQGPFSNQLAVIVDIVNDKRVIIDFVDHNSPRQPIPVFRLKLTDFQVKIGRNAEISAVREAITAEGIKSKFFETNWGKRILQGESSSNLNDFQRYKHVQLVNKREKLIAEHLARH